MSTLMVTPFAPYRDGIATYAAQELRRRRESGESVEVLSPLPSAARWHLGLGGPKGMWQLVAKAGHYDRTIIQFGPELLFGGCGSAARRVAVWSGLAALATRTSLDIRIHEIEYGPLEQNPLECTAARLALARADRVTVHTEAERAALLGLLGSGRPIEVVDHGRDFTPKADRSPAEARVELGLPADGVAFVCIGFLQHHKGFDLAIDAIERVPAGPHLHIVGSARVDHPEIAAYVEQLERRCAAIDAATLHRRFVSDVEFDLWLQAADAVVLPYREIWSSGVIERARLFGTRIVASDLQPLRDQAPAGTTFFSDVEELAVAMEKLWASAARTPIEPAEPGAPSQPLTRPGGPVLDLDAVDLPVWEVDPSAPDRGAIEAQIAARARTAQISAAAERPRVPSNRRPVDRLLALGHLHRPRPDSARPGVAPVKRMIQRLIGWEIEPLARRLEELQRATTEAVAELDERSVEADPSRSRPT